MTRIAIFTDADLALPGDASEALRAVLRFPAEDVHARIFTAADLPASTADYFAAASVGIAAPWDRRQRIFCPRLRAFARELGASGARAVHIATVGPVGLAGRWLARRAGLPIVASVHEAMPALAREDIPPPAAAVLGRVTRWAYSGCESILAPSRAAADALASRGADGVRLWPRGADTTRFSPGRASAALREMWHVDHRRPAVVVPLAALTAGEVGMIEPIRRHLHRHAIAHQFVFAGLPRRGPNLREVCPDGVFIEQPSDDDLAIVMASSDLCLFPGASCVAGGAVLQAQACGSPAIVPDSGAAIEQVVPGRTARLMRAGQVDDAVAGLAALLRSASLRAELGRAARVHALTQDWQTMLAPLHAAWRAALRSPAAAPIRVVTTDEAA